MSFQIKSDIEDHEHCSLLLSCPQRKEKEKEKTYVMRQVKYFMCACIWLKWKLIIALHCLQYLVSLAQYCHLLSYETYV
jgi:hypothetical protein